MTISLTSPLIYLANREIKSGETGEIIPGAKSKVDMSLLKMESKQKISSMFTKTRQDK